MEIKIHQWSDIDDDELARFSYQVREAAGRLRTGATIEYFKQYIRDIRNDPTSVVILARLKGNLIGWLSLVTSFPTMVFMGSWHPIVIPGAKESDIASQLIRESIEFTKRLGRGRLEVLLNGITDDNVLWYEKQKLWYESEGMQKVNEEAYMICDLTDLVIVDVEVPAGFVLKQLGEVNNEEIHNCFFDTFLASKDGLFLDMNSEQQHVSFEYWFSRSRAFTDEASLILMRNQKIVGFSVVRPQGEGVKLGPFGIHPDVRGRGLGKTLLLLSMRRSVEQGFKTMFLEVDIVNRVAYQLYQSAGFKQIHKAIIHRWKDQEGSKE